jgi:hypothetical protein
MPGRTDLRHVRLRFAAVFAAVAGVALAIYSFPYAEHGLREDWFHRYAAPLVSWGLAFTATTTSSAPSSPRRLKARRRSRARS